MTARTQGANGGEPYVAVIGEAIWDLLERPDDGCYRPVPGGSCLNVAVGVARLGHRVEFVGAFSGVIRREALRAIRRSAEEAYGRRHSNGMHPTANQHVP